MPVRALVVWFFQSLTMPEDKRRICMNSHCLQAGMFTSRPMPVSKRIYTSILTAIRVMKMVTALSIASAKSVSRRALHWARVAMARTSLAAKIALLASWRDWVSLAVDKSGAQKVHCWIKGPTPWSSFRWEPLPGDDVRTQAWKAGTPRY